MERAFSLLGGQRETVALSDAMLGYVVDEGQRELGACDKVCIDAVSGVALGVGDKGCRAIAPACGSVVRGGVAEAFLRALHLCAKSQQRASFLGLEVGEGYIGSPSRGVQGDALLLSGQGGAKDLCPMLQPPAFARRGGKRYGKDRHRGSS